MRSIFFNGGGDVNEKEEMNYPVCFQLWIHLPDAISSSFDIALYLSNS